jgi:nuclear transport factor 2 (NTF2) superfamily protein
MRAAQAARVVPEATEAVAEAVRVVAAVATAEIASEAAADALALARHHQQSWRTRHEMFQPRQQIHGKLKSCA